MTNPYTPSHDFQIEVDTKRKLTFYTPLSHRAYDWCVANLTDAVRFGRGYVFHTGSERAHKLAGFLKHYKDRRLGISGFTILNASKKAKARG